MGFVIQEISLGREPLVLRKADLHKVGLRQHMALMTPTIIPHMLPQDCKGMFLKQLSVHRWKPVPLPLVCVQ